MTVNAYTPAWMIDAGSLRSSLDALRDALKKPHQTVVQTVANATVFDRTAITASLKAVLEKINRAELQQRLASSSLATSHRDPAQHKRLDEMLRLLGNATNGRVLGMIGARKSEVLRGLLALAVPDFLSVVSKANDENSHSDVLAWLLTPAQAPRVAPAALSALVRRFENAPAWEARVLNAISTGTLSIRREYVYGREWAATDGLERIDLFISGPGFSIAVENKLWSRESDEQTTGYWAWLSTLPGLRQGVFLTPTGESALCCDFLPLSYVEMLSLLLEAPAAEAVSEAEQLVLASYAKTLRASALRTEMRLIQGPTT